MSLIKNNIWRISATWASRRHECNLAGIKKRCGGACCTSSALWPPMANPNSDGVCAHLGPLGCALTTENRPITCHLYPLTLSKHDEYRRSLVLHSRTTTARGLCKGNHNNGPMIIDVLKDSLIELFGEEQYNRVREDIVKGKDSHFILSDKLMAQWEREMKWAEENVIPKPRSEGGV